MKINLPGTRVAMAMTDVRTIEPLELMMPSTLGENDALVQIKAVGICGSDINYFAKGESTFAKVVYPHILGHEAAGVVVKVGSNVTNVSVSDRVAIEPGIPCCRCDLCLKGYYNLCKDISFMGIPIYRPYSEGALVEYTVRPAQFLFKIPDAMSFEEAAMIEPLSVGLHAVTQANAKVGMSAIILGCGPIATCILYALKSVGIHRIFMVDLDVNRRSMAEQNGAKATFASLDNEAKAWITRNCSEQGVDLVFDTTGYTPLINSSVELLCKAGKLVLIANPQDDKFYINYRELFMRQASVCTSFRYANQYPIAINLVDENIVPIKAIITHKLAFKDTQKAFELALDNSVAKQKIAILL